LTTRREGTIVDFAINQHADTAPDERQNVKAKRKQLLWMVIVGLLICIGAPLLLIGQQFRQEGLDRGRCGPQ
jgi:hypothetical protein